jgi:hypothetical protein
MPSASNEGDICVCGCTGRRRTDERAGVFLYSLENFLRHLTGGEGTTVSNGLTIVSFSPFQKPGLMVPALAKIPGTSCVP